MKPFDIEAAKNGAEVYTDTGCKVRIIAYDRVCDAYPIVALVTDKNGIECVELFDKEGECPKHINPIRLLIGKPEPIKKYGWINLYMNYRFRDKTEVGNKIFATEDEAKKDVIGNEETFICTIKIEWEQLDWYSFH